MLSANPAQAAVLWNWSFNNGNETGTFSTNGTFADTTGSFNFVIDVTQFNVTQSTFAPSLVGATFTESQPTQGFLWNGTTATQFYRNSGGLTNGSNFFSSQYRITMAVSGSLIASNNSLSGSTGFTTLTLTPQSASAVPEPLTILGAATAVGFGAKFKRHLAQSQKGKKDVV